MAKLGYLLDANEEDDALMELSIDLIYEVGATLESEITDLPLETGRPVIDNVMDRPLILRVQAMVSDLMTSTDKASSKPRQAWTQLQAMKSRRQLLTLLTELDRYDNLLIQSLAPVENVKTGKSLQFSMMLKQVNFADVLFTDIVQEQVKAEGPAANRTTQVNKGVLNAQED